ncbi:MFS transporter [Rhizobium sp. AB2/73]|uniref:MFS transporter n=1 Tax=Rhizobium sp. AB2/73 TaxID=2795216 RepID=UPI000DDE13EC|nr:MFS transporter [Rhizobium sp. AB2/73]QYA16613.1 MFS transporter [Rhizobium sp. AB2/73]UEQ84261.1 MFS transporter [Rhizobium sp. AB2/73]
MSRPSRNDQQQAQALIPLGFLNFFMADVQAGIGPFLGVFLVAHGWQSGSIGSVMTIGGIAGMVMMAPAGAFIDETTHKRTCVIVLGICTVLASMIILVSQLFWVVALSQVATAIAGAAIGPALNGITLGIVRQAGFNRQNGYNQAFNHAGNLVGAGLSGWLGWMFGLTAVFWLSAVFGVLTIISVLMIPADAIDDDEARGATLAALGPVGEMEPPRHRKPSGFKVLAESKPLLILAGALALFHLGNGAMLPLFGLAVVSAGRADPAGFVALTVVVAQGTMIITSLLAMHMAERRGQWLVLLVSFISLPIRGFVAAHLITSWGVYPVQVLDGIGAGLQSVAVPTLVARILNETGRINVGQGVVMTMQGVGASLSPAIGGWLAQEIGYGTMFMILGSFALGSIALWVGFHGVLRVAASVPGQPQGVVFSGD